MQVIDKKGFLDKLRYMGYMDESDEVETVADNFTIDAIPREKIDSMIAEITKYAQAMDWISGYDILLLIHKFCD